MYVGLSIYIYMHLCVHGGGLACYIWVTRYVHACVGVSVCEWQGDQLGDLLGSKEFLRT